LRRDPHRQSSAVAALLEIRRAIGRRSILVPTTDDATLFVAAHADVLRDGFILVDLPPNLVRTLCSKRGMHDLARRIGIPTPEAIFPRSRQDVLGFLDRAAFPIMLKGIDGLRLQRRCGVRMLVVRTPDELLEKYDAMEDPTEPNLMLQEYIPGTTWMFNGYFDSDSECLIGFTGRKVREYPVSRGSTSLGICDRNDPVDALTKRFMKAIGYRGILDIGYRHDPRDGEYKVHDVNPRIGATFRLFVAENGMDVARALYLDLTGQAVPISGASEGRKWMVEDFDIVSSLGYRRRGALTFGQWLASLRGIRETAYLAWDDPVPVFAACAVDARTMLRRSVRRIQDYRGQRPVQQTSPAS
jgi:D-aspartate ligase